MTTEGDFLRLAGQNYLVTGASSGIGREAALRLSRHGARVALVARREDELEETLELLSGEGHRAVVADLTDHAATAGLVKGIANDLGPLSGMLHSAGAHATTPLRIANAEQTNRLFDINVTSAVTLMKAFRHPHVRAEDASAVLMSSAVGLVGEAGVSVYAATKAAVASLARSLALELARERIRVNSIAAGIVHTTLTEGLRGQVGADAWAQIEAAHPLGLGHASDVADAALFLLSPASRWITGTALVVDGGYTAR